MQLHLLQLVDFRLSFITILVVLCTTFNRLHCYESTRCLSVKTLKVWAAVHETHFLAIKVTLVTLSQLFDNFAHFFLTEALINRLVLLVNLADRVIDRGTRILWLIILANRLNLANLLIVYVRQRINWLSSLFETFLILERSGSHDLLVAYENRATSLISHSTFFQSRASVERAIKLLNSCVVLGISLLFVLRFDFDRDLCRWRSLTYFVYILGFLLIGYVQKHSHSFVIWVVVSTDFFRFIDSIVNFRRSYCFVWSKRAIWHKVWLNWSSLRIWRDFIASVYFHQCELCFVRVHCWLLSFRKLWTLRS